MRAQATTLAAALALAACGPGYYVEFQNQSSITYWYDAARQSMGSMQRRAQEHCAQYGKDALPLATSGENISFSCKNRT